MNEEEFTSLAPQPEKKTYFEIQLDALNCIDKLSDKRKYLDKIDFDHPIEKDSDASIFKDLQNFKAGIDEGVWKEPGKPIRKVRIEKPGNDRLVSDFAKELGAILKDKNKLYFRPDSKEVVEVGEIREDDEEEGFTGFLSEKPNRFITTIEEYCEPGEEILLKGETFFVKKSIGAELSNTTLVSDVFQKSLPIIKRIFTIPIPIIYKKKLTFAKRGYDPRFKSWLPFEAPEITNPEMSLEEAKELLEKIFEEFCFETEKDKLTAIAALLTPGIRGLFSRFNIRTPLFFYLGNRERAGKEFAANITGIVYEGVALEEPPLSTSENSKSSNTDELRKKICAALISGRKRLHFSNNKGYINNAVLESVLTAESYSDRILGRSEIVTLSNELDFSLSGNTGIGFTADLANRSKFIKLFLEIEDANSREFKNPDLHGWIKQNRGLVLSAIYALIKNWVDTGMKAGTVPFASFPEWARVCGGILETAGYENICGSDLSQMGIMGDAETADMRVLFEAVYRQYPNQWIKRDEIRQIAEKEDTFGYLDFEKKQDIIKFGMKLTKFFGRILSDIKLKVRDGEVRPSRQELMFTKGKDGIPGIDGNPYHTQMENKKENIYYSEKHTRVARHTKEEPSDNIEIVKFNDSDTQLNKTQEEI